MPPGSKLEIYSNSKAYIVDPEGNRVSVPDDIVTTKRARKHDLNECYEKRYHVREKTARMLEKIFVDHKSYGEHKPIVTFTNLNNV